MLKERICELIDVKSIITILLVSTLVFLVTSGKTIDSDIFLLFSNCTTMIVTYFFTKKQNEEVK